MLLQEAPKWRIVRVLVIHKIVSWIDLIKVYLRPDADPSDYKHGSGAYF